MRTRFRVRFSKQKTPSGILEVRTADRCLQQVEIQVWWNFVFDLIFFAVLSWNEDSDKLLEIQCQRMKSIKIALKPLMSLNPDGGHRMPERKNWRPSTPEVCCEFYIHV